MPVKLVEASLVADGRVLGQPSPAELILLPEGETWGGEIKSDVAGLARRELEIRLTTGGSGNVRVVAVHEGVAVFIGCGRPPPELSAGED
jgi:hypothetical protein